VSGYLLVWGVFSLIATVAQWGLASAGLVDAMMRGNSLWFAGLLLIAAVLYQMTPIKDACLRHCQSPIQFVMRNW
jgi:predicted metal-binding membrane protein